MNKYMVLLVFLVGCVTPTLPYVTESNMEELSHHWASTTGSTTKWVTVHNPTNQPVVAKVVCDGNLYEGSAEHDFALASHGEANVLASVPGRYQVGEACYVASFEYTATVSR